MANQNMKCKSLKKEPLMNTPYLSRSVTVFNQTCLYNNHLRRTQKACLKSGCG